MLYHVAFTFAIKNNQISDAFLIAEILSRKSYRPKYQGELLDHLRDLVFRFDSSGQALCVQYV